MQLFCLAYETAIQCQLNVYVGLKACRIMVLAGTLLKKCTESIFCFRIILSFYIKVFVTVYVFRRMEVS